MPTDFDLDAWIADAVKEAGLDEEGAKAFKAAWGNEKLKGVAAKSFKRQAEFNRQMDQLRTDFEAKEADLNKYQTQLADWEGKTKEEVKRIEAKANKAEADMQKLREQYANLQGKAQHAYSTYGLDEFKDIPGLDQPTTPTPIPQPTMATEPTNPKWVDREAYQSEANALARVPFVLQDIAAQHRKLFGEELGDSEELLNMAANSKGKLNLKAAWEQKYNVPEKREQIEQQRIESLVNQRAEEMATKRLSEMMTPSPAREAQGKRSPVLNHKFQLPNDAERPATPEKADPRRGVNAALQAYAEGKYRHNAG